MRYWADLLLTKTNFVANAPPTTSIHPCRSVGEARSQLLQVIQSSLSIDQHVGGGADHEQLDAPIVPRGKEGNFVCVCVGGVRDHAL